jgi:Zn-dependent protease with chaperone function
VRTLETVKSDLLRVTRNALLALFLIPLLTFLFTHHVQKVWDQEFIDGSTRQISADSKVSSERAAELISLINTVPPSRACAATDPGLAKYREDVCDSFGHVWQFHWVDLLAKTSLGFGVAMLAAIALLGRMAFQGRAAQYRSLVLSWRVLAWSSALMVVAQSAIVVWLSFWLTAYFFHHYFIKLIIVFGAIAGLAAITAVVQIFARIPTGMAIPGELVGESDAPALWARIRVLAAKVGTAPPDHIVAGIDANFFVTESAMFVQNQAITGRSLYVSLPLLRVLDQLEADAVLAHELAHFEGGDTSSSAALGPKLAQFDTYCAAMQGPSLTLVTFYLLALYRTIVELALMRDSREREFKADSTAARCVHALPLVRALVKVAAYSSYRNRIERELFERSHKHEGAIGIAASVAQGLQPFARSPEFLDLMQEASMPHPFDSHPKLSERMENVRCVIAEEEFGQVLAHAVANSWSAEILSGEAIESRLWAAYEGDFAQAHEQALAYRYLPDNEAELAIVLKYFPSQAFALDKGKELTVNYDGLVLPDQETLGWSEVKNIEYEDGFGGDVLKLTLTEKGVFGSKTNKVKLPGIKPQRDALKAALGQYWHRHKVARNEA